MSDVAIRVENVSKVYKLYDKPIDRLKETLNISNKVYHKDHYALNDISFEVKKGETVGIIGTNGSGKSTLLKMITGVLTPTSGNIEVNGKVSALLELGAGFNPEYTGMENIYLNGTMMGYSKEEMDKKVQPILEFADIGEFINQPVKTYSSGMFARLAFAVAINVEPEILIVDEALSVGDSKFQTKCIDKMEEIREKGTTILFVSHATEQINRFCNTSIWIEKGNLKALGKSSEIISEYENYMKYGNVNEIEVSELEEEITRPKDKNIMASITSVNINSNKLKLFDKLEIDVEYEIYEESIDDFLLGVAIYTPDREYIFGPNTYLEKIKIKSNFGRHRVKYIIPKMMLLQGIYNIDVGIFNNKGIVNLDYKADIKQFTITNDYTSEGLLYMEHKWEVIK